MEPSGIFLWLFIIDAAVNVAANANEEKNIKIIYVSKPLLMPLLAAHYVTGSAEANLIIVSALAFGFFGDVFLMLPGKKEKMFMAGLVSFLVNQLLFAAAFLRSIDSFESMPAWIFLFMLPYFLYGAGMYRVLGKNLGKMKIPVIVYMLAILFMGISAMLRGATFEGAAFWLVLVGSMSFIVSDSVLAYDKFNMRLRYGRLLVMLTYIAAQFSIARGYMVF